MSERKARERRRANTETEPVYNFQEIPGPTRAQRRLMKFRPREHARQVEDNSRGLRRIDIRRWNSAFGVLKRFF